MLRLWRLVFVSFDVKMWRVLVWPRSTLPVPVFLKRFAAPLCVFSLGMYVLNFAGMATSASNTGAYWTALLKASAVEVQFSLLQFFFSY
jgi:hypothetical protein